MKIVRVSNFDYDDHRGDQYVVAEGIANKHHASVMCEALNEANGSRGPDWFQVVPDDYVLPPKWEP